MQTITEKLHALNTTTAHALQLLEGLLVPVSFKKGTILSAPGHSFPILYYIESGLVRGYFLYQQEEYTSWIMENGFLLPSDFFSKDKGLEYVQFLKDTIGWSLNLSRAEAMAQKEPTMYRILLEIYEDSLHQGKSRELMLRLKHAEDRLDYIQEASHNLIYRISNQIAASYLNMKDKYLFAIKKKRRGK